MSQQDLNQTSGPERPGRYGPVAACREPIHALAADVIEIIDSSAPDSIPGLVARRLPATLGLPDLLAAEHRAGNPLSYQRHLLYADTMRRFSVLAVVWQPGQVTPVHGHTAWGVAGVYDGELNVTLYERVTRGDMTFEIRPREVTCSAPGDVSFVKPGIDDLHRVANESNQAAISIHVYGRDLLSDPASLNIILSH